MHPHLPPSIPDQIAASDDRSRNPCIAAATPSRVYDPLRPVVDEWAQTLSDRALLDFAVIGHEAFGLARPEMQARRQMSIGVPRWGQICRTARGHQASWRSTHQFFSGEAFVGKAVPVTIDLPTHAHGQEASTAVLRAIGVGGQAVTYDAAGKACLHDLMGQRLPLPLAVPSAKERVSPLGSMSVDNTLVVGTLQIAQEPAQPHLPLQWDGGCKVAIWSAVSGQLLGHGAPRLAEDSCWWSCDGHVVHMPPSGPMSLRAWSELKGWKDVDQRLLSLLDDPGTYVLAMSATRLAIGHIGQQPWVVSIHFYDLGGHRCSQPPPLVASSPNVREQAATLPSGYHRFKLEPEKTVMDDTTLALSWSASGGDRHNLVVHVGWWDLASGQRLLAKNRWLPQAEGPLSIPAWYLALYGPLLLTEWEAVSTDVWHRERGRLLAQLPPPTKPRAVAAEPTAGSGWAGEQLMVQAGPMRLLAYRWPADE